MPQVSVILPNYNHAPFLEQRIESILNQTFQDFELILLDDASTDNSQDVLNKYKNHPKVTSPFYNKYNSGSPFGLWSKGIELARGKYVWIAESDDWSDAKFLEKMIPKMKLEEVVVSHCQSFNANETSNLVKKNSWWQSFKVSLWDSDFIRNGNYLLKEYGKYKCPVINVSSALIRKKCLEDINIPINYKYCGDWLFWAHIFTKGDVAFCSEPLNFIRVHINSATNVNASQTLNKFYENFKVAKEISYLLGEKFKYQQKYSWLVDFWVKETLKNRNYLKPRYLFPNIPFSFWIQFQKRMFLNILKID